MIKASSLAGIATLIAMLSATPFVWAQAADPRIADIVQAGKLRVGFGLGGVQSAVRDPATGEVRGPSVDLARALAQKIGVDAQNVMYERSGAVLNGLRTNAWDIAFLVVAPERAAEVDFSTPFMQTDFTYLVRPGSPIRQVADVDQPGVRVAVPRGDASELYLSRMLKNAVVVRTDSIPIAVGLLRSEQADVYAGPRPNAIDEAARFPGSRVLDDGFGIIYRAALVPKGHPERLAYVTEFIESVKASGLIKQLIERYELQGITVAPAGKPGAY